MTLSLDLPSYSPVISSTKKTSSTYLYPTPARRLAFVCMHEHIPMDICILHSHHIPVVSIGLCLSVSVSLSSIHLILVQSVLQASATLIPTTRYPVSTAFSIHHSPTLSFTIYQLRGSVKMVLLSFNTYLHRVILYRIMTAFNHRLRTYSISQAICCAMPAMAPTRLIPHASSAILAQICSIHAAFATNLCLYTQTRMRFYPYWIVFLLACGTTL